MVEYSLTDARAQLPLLLDRALSGEIITITRHGAPAAVVVGHDRWMRSQAQHEVLVRARQLRERLDAAKDKSWDEIGWIENYDAEAHIAEIRAGRDGEDFSGFR